jgi:WD40 repeat protein
MAFHTGVVNDIDLCLRKPLIASCGADKYIKIWNYEDKILEISKHFPDESKCVSIHPSGYQIIVGSSDKLKMIALVNHRSQLKIQKEITVK